MHPINEFNAESCLVLVYIFNMVGQFTKISLFFDFLQQLSAIHQQANRDNKTEYTGDMGAFNYLARTKFNQQLIHGAPVNTVFKQYETNRNDCWFRHK